jgi:RNA polymerase sigma-70 factor (sigma-E family)
MRTELERQGGSRSDPLTVLYVRHAPGALGLAYLLTGDRYLAEDLVQEAFVRIAGRFRHLRAPDAFESYLRRTVVNLFTSELRRRRVERAYLQRGDQRAGEMPTDPVDLGVRDQLWRALGLLPTRQRAAVVLRYHEDLSERDVAAILGCSVPAMKSLVSRGMETLRGEFQGGDDD